MYTSLSITITIDKYHNHKHSKTLVAFGNNYCTQIIFFKVLAKKQISKSFISASVIEVLPQDTFELFNYPEIIDFLNKTFKLSRVIID